MQTQTLHARKHAEGPTNKTLQGRIEATFTESMVHTYPWPTDKYLQGVTSRVFPGRERSEPDSKISENQKIFL